MISPSRRSHLSSAPRLSPFPFPDTSIADRSRDKHLALGVGIHRCLGAHILRVESQVVIEEFLKRIPDFELDHEKKAVWVSAQVSGMRRVPIVFEPGKRIGTNLPGGGVQAWLDNANAIGA